MAEETIEIPVENPKLEVKLQAEIYRTKQGDETVYRVVIGKEGTECPPKEGEFIDYHAISDFMNEEGIEKWVEKKVAALKKDAKKVEFDENTSYTMRLRKLIEQSTLSKFNPI